MFRNIWANFTLEQILSIFKRKLLYILLFTLVVAMGVGYYTYQNRQSTYVADVSFYVYSNPNYVYDSSVNLTNTELTQAKNLVDSYMQILKSRSFLEQVVEYTRSPITIGALQAGISARAVENTAVFVVSAYSRVPQNAMNIANAIGDLAPDEIARIVKSGGIEVVDRAVLPVVPYSSTSVTKYTAAAAMAAFLFATLWFMFWGLKDTTIRRKSDVERLFNIPILGEVPLITPPSKNTKAEKILSPQTPFAIRDAYNSICMNLLFTGKDEKCPVYAVTSAMPSEGKTLNSINLALSFAQLGKKVLLIDADMRKSTIPEELEIPGENGLSQYLAGINNKANILQTKGICVFPAGKIPPNPSELLMSKRCAGLFEKARELYDMIFVDLPPVGIVPDALGIAKHVTAYLLIVREKVARFDVEKNAILKLEQIDAEICGFLYNGIRMKGHDYYKSYMKEYQPPPDFDTNAPAEL